MKTGKIIKQAIIGYPAGIVAGVTYGLNPLFAMPLIAAGAAIGFILFFRYSFAVALLGLYLVVTRQSFRVSGRQALILLVLGLLYTCSSLFLFEAYNYIASGLATTLVFLYPVLVAIIMVFLGVVPSWPVWLSIAATFFGVGVMTRSDSAQAMDTTGIILSICSALAYALFIVIINRSKVIKQISNTLLTFYTLVVGVVVFIALVSLRGEPLTPDIGGAEVWINLLCLAVLPTIVSTATLAVSTRNIGATKASVMGVFEPITAILVGAVAFGEPLTANIVTGILISVAAVTFMILLTKR